MKRNPECVRPQDSIHEAARLMRDKGIGFLPVCDEEEKVLGTITDRDIVIRAVADNRPLQSTTCEDIMSREVVCCRPDDDLSDCEDAMASRRKSRIMICDDDGRLVGVISLSDIAQHERSRKTGKTLQKVTAREAHV
ncbi:MAG: CBS domain-containing protein [Planctomycetes bacterium]|nr:CBS domain-containing protein [Planctomycetota bacterium]